MRRAALLVAVLGVGLAACSHRSAADYTVLHRYPHDTAAFTEGLLYHDGVLFESIGLYGHSEVRRVSLTSGRVLAAMPLAADRFGEGLALLHGLLYQLTWKSGVGYEYDPTTLARVDSFHFARPGWGLTANDTLLIESDGTDTLVFLDPATFKPVRHLVVRDSTGLTIGALNELEYVHGTLYANEYETNWIVKIDPGTGRGRQLLDLSRLVPPADRGSSDNVLNGIAFDPASGALLVTGKRWPVLYEILPKGPPG